MRLKVLGTLQPVSIPKVSLTARALQYRKPSYTSYADHINTNNILTEDTLFSSPSAAAGFVVYASANGLIMWTNGDGKTLRDLETYEE